jgi:pimeloyl-ACP methyl ester carboxylesterase
VIRALLAALTAVALLGTATTSVERIGHTRGAIIVPERAPAGSIILIPGGPTTQSIDERGKPSMSGNFLMRVRDDFVAAGFAVAYLEDPSDLRPAIVRLRQIVRPVFVVGNSAGTAVAARIAATLGADGPDGVVLTSTVTQPGRQVTVTAAAADVRRITIPVLFVHNRNDGCFASPPGGVATLMARFPKSTDVTRIDVGSTRSDGDPCEAFSPHGYLGIEGEVVDKIVGWMHAHGVPEAPH